MTAAQTIRNPSNDNRERATCRGCRRLLDGDAYMYGGRAFVPHDDPNARGPRREAKSCHYGGFVCSEHCDRRACLELERTMPGHDWRQNTLDGNLDRSITRKWAQS